jgi:hypothetical protein
VRTGVKFLFIFLLFSVVISQGVNSKNQNNLQKLFQQDSFSNGFVRARDVISEDEAIRSRDNQDRNRNAGKSSSDNFWDSMNFGDFSVGNQNRYQGQIDEIETGRQHVQLGQRTNKGNQDKGRLRYEEMELTDKGNNLENFNENTKNNNNRFAGRLGNTASLTGIGSREVANKQSQQQSAPSSKNPLLQSSLLNDYGARDKYAYDDNFGSFLEFEDSNENFSGSRSGRKQSDYDKTAKGKKLDHIYDKTNWDNSELVYDNDKYYQKLKSKKLQALENGDVANKYGNQNRGNDHRLDNYASDVGNSNSEKEGYQTRNQQNDYDEQSQSKSSTKDQQKVASNADVSAIPSKR